MREELTRLIHEVRGGDPHIRIFALRELPEAEPPDATVPSDATSP